MRAQANDELILQVRPMVQRLAQRWASRLPDEVHSHGHADDLEQEAMMALCRAVGRWSPSGGASWSTFAYARATGAIRDYLRTIDFGGRNHWQEFQLSSLDEFISADQTVGALLASEQRAIEDFPDPRLGEQLETMLATLTLDEQSAIAMRYQDHAPLAQIGVAMGVSESRVCQLLRSARRRLEASDARSALGE